MQISSQTEYALRALTALALSKNEKPLSVSEICKLQKLPPKYIEQIFRKLKKTGLVISLHGSKGGYRLGRDISEISLRDIMNSLGENFGSSLCKSKTVYCIGLPCIYETLWDEIGEHLDSYFDSIKLDYIISKY